MGWLEKVARLVRIVRAYWTSRHQRFGTVHELHRHQQRALGNHLAWLANNSSYWQHQLSGEGDAQTKLRRLPVVDKAVWLSQFDQANTVGLTLTEAREAALRAETERDFVPTVRGVTVGLSSGTSGSRGVFVVSAAEQAQWAGTVLGRLLPQGLLARERIAFFLRANSNLYTSVRSRRITFQFFDLLQAFEPQLRQLEDFAPTVIVAPAQVLRALALHPSISRWGACTVVSVAEVLEPDVRALLQSRFAHVREVYQATEGLLAMSCEHGQLHLNEEHLWVEREWLDDTRFVPIVTDMARRAQPLLRYRLNDILRVKPGRCACGRASTMLQAIEGRCDDQLQLPSGEAPCVIFADAVSRILAQTLPTDADYELVQHGTARLVLRSTSTLPTLETSKAALTALFARYGVDISLLTWDLLAGQSFAWAPHLKRRRVRRENLPVQAGSTDVAV